MLATALDTTPDVIAGALPANQATAVGQDWPFLRGLDRDLRAGLLEELLGLWTHHSTSLEGNTISLGDTLLILREGITVSGHSLREHQEIHGHRDAITLLDHLLHTNRGPTVSELHDLHQRIQTGVTIDAFAPVGRWKVEPNGTQAIASDGTTQWHDYAAVVHVPPLMDQVLREINGHCKHPPDQPSALVRAFLEIHLGITNVHPYADGNGRLARLLANLPILRAGHPPLLIQRSARREYLQLLGDYCIARGAPHPDQPLVAGDPDLEPLLAFLGRQWQLAQEAVARAHERQAQRASNA